MRSNASLRILCLILMNVMLLFAAAGCSADGKEPAPENPSSDEVSSSSEDTELPEDFIKGMDLSSVISLEQSGVTFYGTDGQPADIFATLSRAGVNYIRVRVWNDPYDEDGNGYGGGNCDAGKATEIGKRAARYGMPLLVDFHYSDFWADPSRQYAPKAWNGMTVGEKQTAVYEFTAGSLKKIADAGADIGMVQIGNEINGGLAGESDYANVTLLLQSASKAVRDFASMSGADIQIAVHYAPIADRPGMIWYADTLAEAGLDYDIFGLSYYPYWHGGMREMKELLTELASASGKKTLILETAYPYTLEDGDGSGNSVGRSELLPEYPASVQGQADCVRAVMNCAAQGGALGVFYWEGAWIPVGSDPESNRPIWEQYGSGWASSYCAAYDPENGGKYYGGSSWDNQAFFDREGKPLESLDVFR